MKKSITYSDFGVGMDRRKAINVSDPNRIWTLKNAYVTTGRAIRKRPCLTLVETLESGTKGLVAANGKLNTFTEDGAITHSNSLFVPNQLIASNVNPAVFSGSGLDDLTSSGSYSGAGTPVFTVEIDGVTTGSITAMADSATSPGVKTTITSNSHGRSNGQTITHTGTSNYNGTYVISNVTTNTYDIELAFTVDDGTGTWELNANTFRWKKDAGAWTSGVAITGGAQLLQEGVYVTFGAVIGHTATDLWTIAIAVGVGVDKIYFADTFESGQIYVAAKHSNGNIHHHYLDGTVPPIIADTNCPQTKQVVKMQERIYCGNEDIVAYSALNDPRDWTTASDAGFLPTGAKQRGAENVAALGHYQLGKLVVFHEDGASQLWNIDPNPANHSYQQPLQGIQTIYSKGVAPLFRDLYVVTKAGIRSISEAELVDSQSEIDVGSPIDSVVDAYLTATADPICFFYSNQGQFWAVFRQSDSLTVAYVFTFSLTAKISAWSEYTFPIGIDDVTMLENILYFRAGDKIYKLDDTVYTDDGTAVDVEVQLPFADAKQPGILKMWQAADVAINGTASLSYLFDPNDLTRETVAISVTGDTRTGDLMPIEIASTGLAPKIVHSADEDFEFKLISVYYDLLGPR